MKREEIIEWKLQNDVKRRLSGIAGSFQRLSGSISGFVGNKPEINTETIEGILAETAADICKYCTEYRKCRTQAKKAGDGQVSELLRLLRENGGYPEEIDETFLGHCVRREEFLEKLEQGFFRFRQGLLWRSRINESREAVVDQLTEMARIVGEFAGNLEQNGSRVWALPKSVTAKLWLKNIVVKQILMLERNDGSVELHLTARCRRGRCMTTREAAMILSCLVGERLIPDEESRNVIGREYSDYVFREDANFQVLTGVARATKADSYMSGDNFSFLYPEGDECIMLLSDGMGSGEAACRESERVIDLLEQFLEAGFKEEAAMKLINSMLMLRTENSMFSTMDVCVIHLASGVCDFMKAGASATYILRGEWMESMHSTTLPAGMLSAVSYDIKQKKLYDGDFVIMLSDGVLEGEESEEAFWARVMDGMDCQNPQGIADHILEEAMKRENYRPKDDMTVLVGRITRRRNREFSVSECGG